MNSKLSKTPGDSLQDWLIHAAQATIAERAHKGKRSSCPETSAELKALHQITKAIRKALAGTPLSDKETLLVEVENKDEWLTAAIREQRTLKMRLCKVSMEHERARINTLTQKACADANMCNRGFFNRMARALSPKSASLPANLKTEAGFTTDPTEVVALTQTFWQNMYKATTTQNGPRPDCYNRLQNCMTEEDNGFITGPMTMAEHHTQQTP